LNLPDIETLALDNNRLKTLPKSIETLKKMKKLTYQGNLIESEPAWLQIVAASVDFTLKMGTFHTI
jgi:Leucine-rich repeat (LRR) protein